MPFTFWAQDSLLVSDLVGVWYGTNQVQFHCTDLAFCTYRSFTDGTKASKLTVYPKGNYLVIKNTSLDDAKMFHSNVLSNIGQLFSINDSIVLPTKNGKVGVVLEAVQLRAYGSNKLAFQRIDQPDVVFEKNRGSYDLLLLAQNAVKKTGCVITESDKSCSLAEFYDMDYFSSNKDTLFFHQANKVSKYKYDLNSKLFVNLLNSKLYLNYSPFANKVVMSNGKDSLSLDLASEINIANEIQKFKGEWLSTSRAGKYLKIEDSKLVTNQYLLDLKTNAIDSLKEFTNFKPIENEISFLKPIDTVSLVGLNVFAINGNVISPYLSLHLLAQPDNVIGDNDFIKIKKTQWFKLGNNTIENVFTGEIFSKVLSVEETSILNELSVSPNPITGDKITLIGHNGFQFQIIGMSGNTILEGSCKKGEEIDASKLHPGLYNLMFSFDKIRKSYKIVKY